MMRLLLCFVVLALGQEVIQGEVSEDMRFSSRMANVVPEEVFKFIEKYNWGDYHQLFHMVRKWDFLGSQSRSWLRSHNEEVPEFQEGAKGNGLEFLVMHRAMIEQLKELFEHLPVSNDFEGFTTMGQVLDGWTTDEQVIKAMKARNLDHRTFERGLTNINNFAQFKDEDEFGNFIQTTLRVKGPGDYDYDRRPGSGVHNWLHGQFHDNSPITVGSPRANLHNILFWRIHGWIEAKWKQFERSRTRSSEEAAAYKAMVETFDERMNAMSGTFSSPSAPSSDNEDNEREERERREREQREREQRERREREARAEADAREREQREARERREREERERRERERETEAASTTRGSSTTRPGMPTEMCAKARMRVYKSPRTETVIIARVGERFTIVGRNPGSRWVSVKNARGAGVTYVTSRYWGACSDDATTPAATTTRPTTRAATARPNREPKSVEDAAQDLDSLRRLAVVVGEPKSDSSKYRKSTRTSTRTTSTVTTRSGFRRVMRRLARVAMRIFKVPKRIINDCMPVMFHDNVPCWRYARGVRSPECPQGPDSVTPRYRKNSKVEAI